MNALSRLLGSLALAALAAVSVAPRALGFTHFVVDTDKGEVLEAAYGAIGLPLVRLARLSVRGFSISVYRFAWASEREQGSAERHRRR